MGRTSLKSLNARRDRGYSPVVVTWNVVEYRKAALAYLEEDDVVLEVGCCGGMTTHLVGRCCPQGMAIGIDQTAAEIAIAKKRFAIEGRVEFYEMDAFDMAAVIKLQKQIGRRFNKVLIDINGSRDIGTVHKCLDKLQKTLMPDLVILKSVHVKTLVLQTSPWLDPADAPPLQPPPQTARLLSDAGGSAPQRPVTHERNGDAAAAARGDDRGGDSPSGRRERGGSAGGGARGAAGRVAGSDDRGGGRGVRGVGRAGGWWRDAAAAALGAAVALGLAAALRGGARR